MIYLILTSDSVIKSNLCRFAQNVTQWWKCAFIGEGIIDHGGGFRDTLSDISEELCPSEADSQLILPFFIPCANQVGFKFVYRIFTHIRHNQI